MMKTLREVLSSEAENIGISEHNAAFQKKIKCGRCGKEYNIPGHIVDHICQNCTNVEEFNLQKWTSNPTMQEHSYWKRKETRNTLIPAIPRPRSGTDEVDDVT